MDQPRYAAFISYRHVSPDQEIAKALHTAIETYGIPAAVKKQTGKKRMGKVFRDQEELPISADLGGDIETALDASEWFIAICSPRYLESRWCLREMEYFISKKGRGHVLTVLVEGEPSDSFPEMIRFTENEAGERVETEPLAANVRGANLSESLKKLKNEKLRILAPMLSLSFDDLKRRARQRKIRLAATVSAIALSVAIGVSAFLIVNHNRQERLKAEAAEQARIAAEQAQLAEERRKQAEEEQRRAEEERKAAVYNDLGERMERISIALLGGERREAAEIALDALSLSDENGQMRRDEILTLLRRTMYIEPFTSVFRFNNQNMQMLYITPSPDGTRAIGVVNSNAIAMIDLLQNRILYTVSAENGQIIDPCFSQDGTRFLANCDNGRTVRVWNTADGSEAFSYVSKANKAYQIANQAFWTDADTLIVQDANRFRLVHADGTEQLFYTYGQQMEDYDPSKNLISRIVGRSLDEIFTSVSQGFTGVQMILSEDRDTVVITGLAGETAVIVLNGDGSRRFLPAVPNENDCIMPGLMTEKWAISPDGRTLIGLSAFGIIFGWDLETGEMLLIDGIESDMRMPSEPVFSPDSACIAYALGSTLFVSEARTNSPIIRANLDDTQFQPTIRFTADGNYLLLTNESMFIINTETWALELIETPPDGLHYNALVPVGNLVLAARYDGVLTLYSTPSIASIETRTDFDAPLCEAYEPLRVVPCVPLYTEHEYTATFQQASAYKNDPARLCFSTDGNVAAMVYPDGAIELFDALGDGRPKETVSQLYTYISTVAITGNRLIAMDVDTRLLIYNMDTHTVESIQNNGTLYSSFAFNADESLMLALCAGLTRIDVIDLNDGGRILFSLHATADTFTDFAFTQDGAYAVGVTSAGLYVVADLWQDDHALIAQAKRLVGE